MLLLCINYIINVGILYVMVNANIQYTESKYSLQLSVVY